MTPFDPTRYSTPFAKLWAIDRLPELGPGRPNVAARAILGQLMFESAFPVLRDRSAAKACLSGIWLYHDCLHESHAIGQDLPEWFGAYWHGIMHRREPDPGNAKYWFRRVSANPVYESLALDAAELGLTGPGNSWIPFDFVDACEKERGTGSAMETVCQRVQLREMQLLFDWCYRRATSD